jgi:biotin-dependent carboxylase-like uncharacterized protein
MSATCHVLTAGALVTVQDRGRPGLAHLGVPRAGWLDPVAATLANRLVGNHEDAAVLEAAGGALRLRLEGADRWVAVTGAPGPVSVDGVARPSGLPLRVRAGAELTVGAAARGVRRYLALGGGLAVPPVLGSRSTDTLAWVGPPPVRAGAALPLGEPHGPPPAAPADVVAPARRGPLRVLPGPRADWFAPGALELLCSASYAVTADANRVGLRLSGPVITRSRTDELPSEGLVLGAVQVPADGQPVVFLADHPTTGGYPVLAVLDPRDVGRCAQLAPGDEVRFTARRG